MPTEERDPYHHEELIEEHSSFEELTRGLAAGNLARSRVLKLAGVGFLASVLGVFGFASPAESRRKRRRRSSCAPCTPTQAPPPGTCCLTPFLQLNGCLVPTAVCLPGPPPPGTACSCI